MLKINVIVAKKDRDEHYKMFHHYLNLIIADYDIEVTTSVCKDKIFNKAKLLNQCLSTMRQDYDAVCVFDIDMIYSYQFFSSIETMLFDGYDYIVSYGQKLSKEQSRDIIKNKPHVFVGEGETFKGCSQIALTKKTVELFKDCFGMFYDENYEKWGGEDSDISFKSKVFAHENAIKKRHMSNAWYHLWHPTRKPDDYREKDKNSLYFQESKKAIEEKIIKYVS